MTRVGMIIGIPGPEVVRVKSKRGMEVFAELTICAAGKGVACPAGKATEPPGTWAKIIYET